MAKFTTAEVQARIAELSPANTTISRLTDNDPQEIVDSVKDLIGRTLNGDPDCLYYLIKLFMGDASKVAEAALNDLATIERMAIAAQKEPPRAGSQLADILDIVAALEHATGSQRTELLSRLSTLTELYVLSNKTLSGASLVEVSPSSALEQALAAVNNLMVNVSVLLESFEPLIHVEQDYLASPLLSASRARQSRRAHHILEQRSQEPTLDRSETILDVVVANSLLTRQTDITDPTLDKYSGAVTTNDGTAARVEGGSHFPIAIPRSTFALDPVTNATIDGTATGNITIPASAPPEILVDVPAEFMTRTESGHAQYGDGVFAAFAEALKTTIKPLSLTVTAIDNTNTIVVGTDDGVWPIGAIAGAGIAFGTVDYSTGVCVVQYNNPILAGASIQWDYTYHPLCDMKVRNNIGIHQSDFNTFSVMYHHTLLTGALSQLAGVDPILYNTLTLLAAQANAALPVSMDVTDPTATSHHIRSRWYVLATRVPPILQQGHLQ